MSLFKPAENTSAFLKMGLMGFPGSGKTYTATEVAIGLIKLIREGKNSLGGKPLFFIDTELGSDWVKPRIEAAGIDLRTAKTRSFNDLLTAVPEAEANASVLLIDSITHFWTELGAAYMKRKGRMRLQFDDWAYLKAEWRKFTDLFVNSNLHILMNGRAGYEWDYFEDDSGKKQLEKTGVKMKAESEMGYEPSLLVLMERAQDMETMRIYHDATVLKDRSTLLDGKVFRNPTFETFLPHIKLLNLGGRQMGVDTSRTSEASIPADKRESGPVQRRIAIDEIQTLITLHVPGQAAADKKRKIELIRKHFNASWTEIEEVMPLFDLRAGYDALHRELEGVPSRYTMTAPAQSAPTKPVVEEMNDSLPDHSAPPAAQKESAAADPLDIPQSLKRGKSRRDLLIEDIQKLDTLRDTTYWGLEVSANEKGLSSDDQAVVSAALLRRQREIQEKEKAA